MTDHQFYACWGEIPSYIDRDTYISDMALSSILGGGKDCGISQEHVEQLGRMWDVYHMSMRDLRAASGLSQVKYGERYLIPRRTVEDWDAGLHLPPVCPLL